MNAKEMFEKLGYELYEKTEYKIVYINTKKEKGNIYIPYIKEYQNNGALPKLIEFWKDIRCVDFEYGGLGSYLYLELLQAINKQVEELGWNNER